MVLTVLDSLHFQINLKISLSIYIFFKKWDFWWDSGIVLSLQINLGIMSILTISVFCAKNMVCVCAKSLQSCPTLCDLMYCKLPGSSVHGIFQARILEWVAMPFSRGSSYSRDRTWVSWTVGRFFIIWATRDMVSLSFLFFSGMFYRLSVYRICVHISFKIYF